MDDKQAFTELSALLTGLYDPLLIDQEDRILNAPIAEEYARRLSGTFLQKFPALLDAYKTLAAANPKPPIDEPRQPSVHHPASMYLAFPYRMSQGRAVVGRGSFAPSLTDGRQKMGQRHPIL